MRWVCCVTKCVFLAAFLFEKIENNLKLSSLSNWQLVVVKHLLGGLIDWQVAAADRHRSRALSYYSTTTWMMVATSAEWANLSVSDLWLPILSGTTEEGKGDIGRACSTNEEKKQFLHWKDCLRTIDHLFELSLSRVYSLDCKVLWYNYPI